jgi:hypothetical protein
MSARGVAVHRSLAEWHPTPAEVAAIVAEMRPIIRADAERCAVALRVAQAARRCRRSPA